MKFSVVGLSETWLNDASDSPHIYGFNFIPKNRVSRTVGGVGFYIADI